MAVAKAGSGTGVNRRIRSLPLVTSEKLDGEATPAGSKFVGWKVTVPRVKLAVPDVAIT
jgi:hypothetical protein